MAGIKANSVSATMLDGATSTDNAVSGYLVGEQITLSTTPAGVATTWSIAKPSGATSRSDLNSSSLAAPVFTPDVGGYWTVTAVVDGTPYVLRIAAADVAVVTFPGAMRLLPLTDVQVPAPPTGVTLYYSSTQSSMAIKLPDDSVATIDTTAVVP